ncbi:MAG: CRISPR-associated endonuclease Cas1 [bacterium]|nr:CRISPR-associated endonuclease Cas1 [bacterium]
MHLFVNTPGTSVTQKDECFRLKKGDKVSDESPMKVKSIIICNKAMISTQAIALALEHKVDVIFLDSFGDPIGRVWFSKMGSTALIRRKQLEAAEQPIGLELVTDMVRQKLENQVRFLKKLMHARPGKESQFTAPLGTIENVLPKLDIKDRTLEEVSDRIRGLEGAAGAAYFQCISKMLPEKYRFDKRSKRPARDPFNASLNYCYGILYSLVEKACILSGLDPYVGFLHVDNYNKKSMVYDFIEPFRIYAEQTTVYLFTGKNIKDEYFDFQEGAVSLNQNGKPVVVGAMNKLLDEPVRYRRKNVKRKDILLHEAHKMANILLADEEEKRPDWLEIKEF